MVVACQIFSRVFWISVKRCTSQKVWESVGNPGIVENSSDFKWIKSSFRGCFKSSSHHPPLDWKIASQEPLATGLTEQSLLKQTEEPVVIGF
jgi:hypothetical protein